MLFVQSVMDRGGYGGATDSSPRKSDNNGAKESADVSGFGGDGAAHGKTR